jgi:nucleoside-diphosphate-sugar epimerase
MLLALTGATGFIGQHLLRELPKRGYRLRVLLRRPTAVPTWSASAVIGDLARPQNMSEALAGVDAVIHSAGLAQAMSGVPEDDYRVVNTEATIGLARAARRAGAKRFIFLSSIRAQCGPSADRVQTEDVEPRPTDAYGKSKLAAERGLAEIDIDWVSLRAMLVYGPGVSGNMAQLIRFARSPFPLPVGSPATLLELLFRAAGREYSYERLSGSLVADPSALIGIGWTPPLATAAGLARLMHMSGV